MAMHNFSYVASIFTVDFVLACALSSLCLQRKQHGSDCP